MPKDRSPSPAHRSPSRETEPTPPPKRGAPEEATESAPRGKRGKYTSLACNECKRRKLKCVPVSDGNSCERCNTRNLLCIFAVNSPKVEKRREEVPQIQSLSEELAHVRHELANLSQAVHELKQLRSPPARLAVASSVADHASTRSPSNTSKDAVPKHPQFVGPTRPAFGLMIAERSLTRMGIPDSPSSPSGSGPASPDAPPNDASAISTDVEFWAQCSAVEAARLMGVFEEEVESVYPYIDIMELASRSEEILGIIRRPELLQDEETASSDGDGTKRVLSSTDIDLAKLTVAIGIAIEAHGKNNLCAAIASSVTQHTARVSQTEVSLRGIQLLITLSIYYFHSDDELLAWRAIGVAARDALEMGLHRKKSLYDNFIDAGLRQKALRVFCCCYILDRRWSFGTSLSFALVDGDIDPTLLEIELDSPYLKCMIGYAHLCSKLWEAIPPFGSANPSIPHELAYTLDASAQEWLDSIPPHLQMRHPRALYSTRSQPRVLHRLRALLYLRGNLTRISIYQHQLLSATTIAADPQRARIAVELAQDTVQVLVHLNATSDIYSRQQNAFNYFLASAFAVISLAMCHAPQMFAPSCGQSFLDAAGLVKKFSRHSIASKRLWKSIRGLLPKLKSLGIVGGGGNNAQKQDGTATTRTDSGGTAAGNHGNNAWRSGSAAAAAAAGGNASGSGGIWDYNARQTIGGMHATAAAGGGAGNDMELLPGMNPDILNLFDALGDETMFSGGGFEEGVYGGLEQHHDGDGGDISRLFLQGLM